MDIRQFLSDSRSIIVAGKGGTGKSTVARSLATVATSEGMSVLLVVIDGAGGPHSAADNAADSADILQLSAGSALSEYLASRGLGVITRQLDRLGIVNLVASTAPGIDDLLVLGKLKQLVRDDPHDVIIVDGPAAGHAVDLLRAPRVLGRTINGGPIADQAADVLSLLADPKSVRVMLVTRPAATPVAETVETATQMVQDLGVTLAPVVVNGVHGAPPVPVTVTDARLKHAVDYVERRSRAEIEAVRSLTSMLPGEQLTVSHHSAAGDDLIRLVATDLTRAIRRWGR
jgi:anion-transporting  ArsA/GET3 family ATPase